MIKINLLPPEKRKKLRKTTPARKKGAGRPKLPKLELKFDPVVVLPLAGVILAVVLIAGSYFWLGYQQSRLREQRDQARIELNRLNQVISRVNDLKQRTQLVRQRMEVILDVDRNRFLWPRILDELSAALPRYTWLQTVHEITPFPQMTVRLEGNTMSNLLLSELIENLQQRSSMLENIRLISSSERLLGGYETMYFILEADCALNEEQADSTAAAATVARK